MRINDYTCKFFGSSKNLAAFLSDVRKYSVPTPEEEEKLIIDYKNGDEDAFKKLLCGHLRFIYSLAKIYARDEDEVIDYVDEGVIGFKYALSEFDTSRDYKFITYAVWYVRRSMNAYLNGTRNIIVRSNGAKIGKKVDIVKQKYYAENGREPSVDEIKELIEKYYGIEVKEDCDVYDVNVASINEEIDDDYTMEDNSEYNQRTSVNNQYEETIDKDYVKALVTEALKMIPDKQADIIRMLYGIDYDRKYSTQEVGEKYRMRAVEVAALRDKILTYIRQNAKKLVKSAV